MDVHEGHRVRPREGQGRQGSLATPLTVVRALGDAEEHLRAAGVHSPRLDASLLLAHVLGVARHRLPLEPGRLLTDAEQAAFDALVAERVRRRPVPHLVGRAEFWSLPFEITGDALVPRPETEMLVQAAAAHLRGSPQARAADIGTGSGCIAIALAHEVPTATVTAVDSSSRALAVARRNAVRNGVADRVRFLRGDLLAPLASTVPPGSLDVVLSNPPYVRRSEAGELDPEVLWEPAGAIFCDGEPAALYAQIAAAAAPLLRAGGLLLLETPDRGTDAIRDAVVATSAYEDVLVEPDFADLPRMLRATRRR